MWGIWDYAARDWYRELPSPVDDGGTAILAFTSEGLAAVRATKAWGFDDWSEAKASGNFEVRRLPDFDALHREAAASS